MKNKFKVFALSALSLCLLPSCEPSGQEASFINKTEGSIYGTMDNFTIKGEAKKSGDAVKSGDKLVFTVKPEKYYSIGSVTNNGVSCKKESENADGSQVWSTKIVAGKNNLIASYDVDATIDFVDEFKLTCSDELFTTVMNYNQTGVKTGLDFRRAGIEKMQAPLKWASGQKKSSGAFVNYVDGDTTHVETANLQYTVKIRYLSIDTPESTSEIEEWGLSASNYSKYIYSGETKYLDTIRSTFSATDLASIKSGVTSLILVSQEMTKNIDTATVADLKIGSEDEGPYHASTDGNQRNLAYVWYSTVQNPKKSDFRCLNLEMVYQGFSIGVGSSDDTSPYYFKMFNAAYLSAQANKRHLHSSMVDPNYYYYEGYTEREQIDELSLARLYSSARADSDIKYYPESSFCDKKTLYRVKGYVTRKVGTSFYMQSKPSYTREEVLEGKALGIYVFTYSETRIKPGDYVEVVGAISSYGGTFQIQGISYHDIASHKVRDTKIISRNHEIVPVEVTGAELNSLKLPSVLVKITDMVWFYDFTSVYREVEESISEGGSEEVNKYNTAYPFYNTSNSPIFYGSYGDTDNAAAINAKYTDSQIRYTDEIIRFTVDQNIIVSYGTEKCYSYRFFTGGQYWYHPTGAEYASEEYAEQGAILKTFNRKKAEGIVGISHGYESTGGNKKMTVTICSGSVNDINLSEV